MTAHSQLHGQVLSSLTTLVRHAGDEGERTFGEDLSRILTSVAANVGGARLMIDGDRGELVLALLEESAPEALGPYRTEPIKIAVSPKLVLDELGWDDLHHDSRMALLGQIPGHDAAGLPPVKIKEALAELKVLRAADESQWFRSFQEVATAIARDLGLTVPVEITRRGEDDAPGDTDELVGLIFATAVNETPLPGSGIAPAAYEGLVWETELAEGRAPHERIATRV